ncbi:hypothetical protein [Rhizobium sp. L245/93]|uniref:oxidoreductase n=1 Tax=Rhizobium sp. L245/93 TaxID=2819998 RepID=UPI001AD988C5|nr:hypothetical protein [Rhizobium sp. L245/93]MBO9166791.1 hypothetical protein [Rhizobium sp. L245/93]
MISDTNILNRHVFFLPVNTGFVTHGEPDSRFIEFYDERSSPELYCSIVGNVVVPDGFGSNTSTPMISTSPIWSRIAKSIKAGGSKPGMQLATTWEGYTGIKNFLSNDPQVFIPEARQLVGRLNADSIANVLTSFELATCMAIDHGFEHIQIHAAHGYLLSLLVDGRINRQAASVLDRLSLLADRISSRGAESSIRISLRTGDQEFDSTDIDAFHNSIVQLPFDFVDLSSGFYNIDKRLIYPSTPPFIDARLEESMDLGIRHPDRAFIISGRISTKNWSNMPLNLHPGLCRDLIANPKFLSDLENGCRNHSKCHYYSRGTHFLTCGRWNAK